MGDGLMREQKLKLAVLLVIATFQRMKSDENQPLSKIAIHKAVFAIHDLAYIRASPTILGLGVTFIQLDFVLSLSSPLC